MRIARITAAEPVAGADKLLKLTVDIGFETRTVFAGIKAAYDPEDLVGRLTVVVANLKHRKMRFGTSQGMALAAGPGGEEIWMLGVDDQFLTRELRPDEFRAACERAGQPLELRMRPGYDHTKSGLA